MEDKIRRRDGGILLLGFLASFGVRRFPKGERKALWCARRRIPLAPDGDGRADYGAGAGLAVLWGSVPEGFQRASGKPFGALAGAYSLPRVGNDAPTAARVGTCRLMVFSKASVPEGFQRASGKPFGAPTGACPLSPMRE